MSRLTRRCVLCLSLLWAPAAPALAQGPGPAPAKAPGPLRIFLDCQTTGCDFDYFRTSIPWLDWMRERRDADVHVLVTEEPTGGGGTRYTLTFLGRGALAGREDTLSLVTPAAATPDEVRKGLAQRLRVGVVAFAARTPLLERLTVDVPAAPGGAGTPAATHDPWHYWVFSLNANPYASGESSYRSFSLSGGFSATRVTPEWKHRFAVYENYSQDRYELTEGFTRTVTRSYSLNTLDARSVSEHWSAGLVGSAGSSTYDNYALTLRGAPALEYDLFPYKESTRRQLTVLYSVGADYLDYNEPTIFRKTRDRLLDQALNVSLSLRQPWGSISGAVEGTHYLTWRPGAAAPAQLRAEDAAKYSLTFFGGVDLRLVKGLSLSAFGDYARIHNQINLPASGASDEDILLRLRQLETSYRYYTYIGLRYTFGSIHNNIVNPRFGSSGGGSTMVIMF